MPDTINLYATLAPFGAGILASGWRPGQSWSKRLFENEKCAGEAVELEGGEMVAWLPSKREYAYPHSRRCWACGETEGLALKHTFMEKIKINSELDPPVVRES